MGCGRRRPQASIRGKPLIFGAAGAGTGQGVVIPRETAGEFGVLKNADVPISSAAHVRSGNLVSDSRSDHGKASSFNRQCTEPIALVLDEVLPVHALRRGTRIFSVPRGGGSRFTTSDLGTEQVM